jgi:hypothetical protein
MNGTTQERRFTFDGEKTGCALLVAPAERRQPPRVNCAHFILTVWDSGGPTGTFDAMAALAGWDRAHRAAFIEWAREPWWP